MTLPLIRPATVADAEAKLTLAGLQLGNVSYVEKEYDDSTMYGLVIWQSETANSQVDTSKKIYLQVSKKPSASQP